ncbi:MAG: hypothetical protein J6J81_02665, partial [Oscillospiraceae bacterium]|nr:hypothetical protein [Oscillospiraceae bacterium]
LFGQVKDPSAAVLYVEGPGANRATLPESTWITRNGCRFFFLPIDKEKRGGPLAVAVLWRWRSATGAEWNWTGGSWWGEAGKCKFFVKRRG